MIFDIEITDTERDGIEYNRVYNTLLKLRKGEYVIEIFSKKKKHSKGQSGYYHGILILAIALKLGWLKEEVHNYIMETYFPIEKVNPITGEVKTIGRSSSNFDTKEYTELIDVVRSDFLQKIELGVPPPDQVTDEYARKLRETYKNRYHT